MKALGGGSVACPIGPAPSLTAHLSLPGMGGIIFRKTVLAVAARDLLFSTLRRRHACAAQRAASIQLVDDAGDTLRLAAPARRVVSLIPAATELLFAIGADASVVGRTSYCDYPAAAKAVPDLGDGIKPSIEAMVARRPDLVVLYNSGQNAAVAGRLRELGIPEVRLNTDALSDVGRVARAIGPLDRAPACRRLRCRGVRHRARLRYPAPRRLAPQGPAAGLGAASHDHRAGQLPERAGGARGRREPVRRRDRLVGGGEYRGGGGSQS